MLLWRLISGGNIFLSHSQHKTFMHLLNQSLLKPKILPTLVAILVELVCVTYGCKENECMRARELMTTDAIPSSPASLPNQSRNAQCHLCENL